MPTTILLIHRQLAFAVSVKQALERTGTFEVHPFTIVDSAIEYLVAHPQDLAIIDFEMPSASGDEITLLLRDTQAEIPIIATPLTPDPVLTALKLQGSVEARFTAREVIPQIEQIIATRKPGTIALSQDPESGRSGLLTRVIEQKKTDVLPKTRPQPNDVEMPPRSEMVDSDYDPYFQDEQEDDVDVSALFDDARAAESASVDPSSLFADFEHWVEPHEEDALFDDLADNENFDEPADTGFDDVLTAIEGSPETGDRPRDKFDNLVDSMRTGEERKPLPARQQFIEFTLATGMDSLVEQIERKRTTEVPKVDLPPEDNLAEQLAADEPPPPSFEDSGTVGDLITGVNDSGFQNVLSILRGEEVAEEPEDAPTLDDLRANFDDDDFLSAIESDLGIAPRPASFPDERVEFDFDSLVAIDDTPGESTPAKLILEKTGDASPDSDSFSINDLLDSIERELPAYRPKIQAPPSWLSEEDPDIQELLASITAENDVQNAAPETLPEMPVASVGAAAITSDMAETADFEDIFSEAAFEATAEDEFDFDALLAEDEDADDFYDQTTIPSRSQQIPDDLSSLETEMYEISSDDEEPELVPADWGLPEDSVPEELHADENFSDDSEGDVEDIVATVDALAWDDESDDAPSSIPEMDTSWGQAAIAAASQAAEEPTSTDAITHEPPRIPGYDTEFERMATFAFTPVGDEPPPLETTHIDDPYIAQLALSLTDVSLELTADATLLSRSSEIVAYAGRMPREEMTELREVLGDDWDAKEEVSRIRFVNLPASGKDYMVYSRRTVDNLTLTLIFAGETQLRDIRQQGKRLIGALQSVPEVPTDLQSLEAAQQTLDGASMLDSAGSLAVIEDDIARSPFAYVWILRDSENQLPRQTAQAIVSGMSVQLREQAWRVRELRAADEYVYLLADVPGEITPNHIIRELKRRSAHIASAQNKLVDANTLWADSYLVVTPGRSLDMDEIQQFINFERML